MLPQPTPPPRCRRCQRRTLAKLSSLLPSWPLPLTSRSHQAAADAAKLVTSSVLSPGAALPLPPMSPSFPLSSSLLSLLPFLCLLLIVCLYHHCCCLRVPLPSLLPLVSSSPPMTPRCSCTAAMLPSQTPPSHCQSKRRRRAAKLDATATLPSLTPPLHCQAECYRCAAAATTAVALSPLLCCQAGYRGACNGLS